MTCNITYQHSSGGRSLHKLGEILSVYCYDLLLDVDTKIVHHHTWFRRDQRILTIEDFGLDSFDTELFTLYIDEFTKNNPVNWWGISYNDF